MSSLRRPSSMLTLYHTMQLQQSSYLFGSSRSYTSGVSNVPEIYSSSICSCLYKGQNCLPWTHRSTMALRSTMSANSLIFLNDKRFATTQVKEALQMAAPQVSMFSPGIIRDPYEPPKAISLWRRLFTRSGRRTTKEEAILSFKSFAAYFKLMKIGYNAQKFANEILEVYGEINILMANGDINNIGKAATEQMYSTLKIEIRLRENMWSKQYWELVGPTFSVRLLHARLIRVDRNDPNKVFMHIELEILAKQKFEAYDFRGTVVAGDKTKEILVCDTWVFERSMFDPEAHWRLCGPIEV